MMEPRLATLFVGWFVKLQIHRQTIMDVSHFRHCCDKNFSIIVTREL